MRRLSALIVALGTLAAACTGSSEGRLSAPTGPLDRRLAVELDDLVSDPQVLSEARIRPFEHTEDVRVAWVLVDLLRFHQGQPHGPRLARALTRLTRVRYEPYEGSWVRYANRLMRDDVAGPPGYVKWKRRIFVGIHDRWEPFFDNDATIDWRHVTWGGVLRDAIQSLDSPPSIPAARADWKDDEVVFGVAIDDSKRAYPRWILEVHEIVNDVLGSRPFALTYCTLCGSAIAYDSRIAGLAEPVEMGTSGLLNRSNKLMFDRSTESMFDQFKGTAVSGPLLDEGVELEPIPVAATTWGEWRRDQPTTTVLPSEIGGRSYEPDPVGGRDDEGPIFPVGQIDPRLEPQAVVFGVVDPHGQTIAFPVTELREALDSTRRIRFAGVEVRSNGGGLVARAVGGPTLRGHEAYWFAWSQFHPRTLLWEGG